MKRLTKNEISLLRWLEANEQLVHEQGSVPEIAVRICLTESKLIAAIKNLWQLDFIDAISIMKDPPYLLRGITAEGRQYLRELDAKRSDLARNILIYAVKEITVPMIVACATAWATAYVVSNRATSNAPAVVPPTHHPGPPDDQPTKNE